MIPSPIPNPEELIHLSKIRIKVWKDKQCSITGKTIDNDVKNEITNAAIMISGDKT